MTMVKFRVRGWEIFHVKIEREEERDDERRTSRV